MKIMVGICTYNRKDVVRKSFESLKRVKDFRELDVHVFDDQSSEYSVEYLQELLPDATVTRRERHLGPDMNTLKMFTDFLNTDNDILIIGDSDLIYGEGIISVVREKILEAEFFSVFNTPTHPSIREREDGFIEKENVGAAGSCMSRRVVNIITKNMKTNYSSVDGDYCKILKNHGIKSLTLKNSLVQHIGWQGANSVSKAFDYGMNFTVDSLENAKILEELAEKVISYDTNVILDELNNLIGERTKYYENTIRYYKNSLSWRITAPLRKVGKIFRHYR